MFDYCYFVKRGTKLGGFVKRYLRSSCDTQSIFVGSTSVFAKLFFSHFEMLLFASTPSFYRNVMQLLRRRFSNKDDADGRGCQSDLRVLIPVNTRCTFLNILYKLEIPLDYKILIQLRQLLITCLFLPSTH